MENDNKKKEQCIIQNFSNCAECSGCGKRLPTVNRYMFDGMCADCTDKALYDYDFAKRSERRNEELKRHCC